MALPHLEILVLRKKAKELGFPEDQLDRFTTALYGGSKDAEYRLRRFIASKDKDSSLGKIRNVKDINDQLNPDSNKDEFASYRENRRKSTNKNGYDFDRFPGQENDQKPEGDFITGTPAYYENIPMYSKNQSNYMNSSLDFAANKMPQMYDEWGKLANRGLLGEFLGDDAEKGIQGLLGGLGQYLPQLLGAGAGTALTGGGIGDILQSLIGSIASQRLMGNNNQGRMGQNAMQQQQPTGNIPSDNGSYYNQGMNALSDLWNNRGQYRR